MAKKKYQVPYSKYAHEFALFSLVCRGLRPRVPIGFPTHVLSLYARCMATTPQDRPSLSELLQLFNEWIVLCHLANAQSLWPLSSVKLENVLQQVPTSSGDLH
jgi:hypothetical protein